MMHTYPSRIIEQAVEEISKLPGIGKISFAFIEAPGNAIVATGPCARAITYRDKVLPEMSHDFRWRFMWNLCE
jgi:hypothetical protein